MTYRRRQHPIVGHICQQHTRCTTRILLHFEKTLLGTLCRTTSLTRLRMSLPDTYYETPCCYWIETHDAARARGCWRSSHDGQLTILYCVPTNPGPRSFHAWAIRRCHWPVPQPIVRLLKSGLSKSTNPYPISPDPEYLGPRESISDNTLFHVSSPSSRHAPART